jgi:LuxR family maltose regulon positive regulatory protein
LLSGWARQVAAKGFQIAWISLTQRDNEFGLFWDQIISALEGISSVNAFPYPDWKECSPDNQELFLTRLINTSCLNIKHDTFLVLEDIHHLNCPEIYQWLAFLLEFAPATLHLVITCRGEPRLPLSRFRSTDQLIELSVADLRFTPEESRVYFNECNLLNLSPSAMMALEIRTAGWITGMHLAALAMRHIEDPKDFIPKFTGTYRFVSDYLEDQIFSNLEPSMQAFLLRTSILSRFNGQLCDSIMNNSGFPAFQNSQKILDFLDRTGFFLLSLDERREWYCYHPLLAEFLRERLTKTYLDQIPLLHLHVAKWLEQHNFIDDAIPHALAAHNYPLASKLIVRIADDWLARGKVNQVLGWLTSLPRELVQAHPRLCLTHVTAQILSGQFDAAEACLRSVEASLIEQNSPAKSWHDFDHLNQQPDHRKVDSASFQWRYETPQGRQALIDILNAIIERHRFHPQAAILLCLRALDHIPLENTSLRSLALMVQGQAFMLIGDLANAALVLSETMQYSLIERNQMIYSDAMGSLAHTRRIQGHLRQACAIYQQAIAAFGETSEIDLCGIEGIGLGDLLCEMGQLEQAQLLIDRDLFVVEASGLYTFRIQGYLAKSHLCKATGDLDSALDWANKALRLAQRCNAGLDLAFIQAYQTRLWLLIGNLPAAELWALQADLPGKGDQDAKDVYISQTFAYLFIAQGRLSDARILLARLRKSVEEGGQLGQQIEIMAQQAILLQMMGDSDPALSTLAQAVALAAPEGFQQLFIDLGTPMAELLTYLARRQSNGLQNFINQLLAAFPKDMKSSLLPMRDKSTGRITELSERELQVLRLIEAGHSYQQIAAELVIALSTVQSHIKNAYAKLDSHTALEAILRARELDLLP